jgi:hypothetical protein
VVVTFSMICSIVAGPSAGGAVEVRGNATVSSTSEMATQLEGLSRWGAQLPRAEE